jgi:hypothetical protein
LLGDEPKLRDTAQRFLGGSFSVEKVRAGFDVEREDKRTLPEIIPQYSFVIKVVNPKEFVVTNLLGRPLTVHAMANPEHVFAGWLEHQQREGRYYVGARLLNIQVDREDAQLVRILRESVRKLFENTYCHPRTNLESMWDKLAESEQVNLAVAQRLILDSAFSYLKSQLGVRTGPLNEVFKAWDDARFGVAQEQILGGVGEKVSAAYEQEAKERLRALLLQDQDVQNSLLAALRTKLQGFQYKVTSVPFELFQNADDALTELERLGEEPQQHVFRVIASRDGLSFMHWGRMINYSPQGRTEEYHRDLEKMLTLNASDKSSQVTGKFGLGFKSVFLITDRPRVVSGDLGFEVAGGVYPIKLGPELFERLRTRLTDFGARSGTIIHLPLEQEQGAASLARFRTLAPFLLAFSRSVKQIILQAEADPGTAQGDEWVWQSRQIATVPGLALEQIAGQPHLHVRGGTTSLLFRLDREGFAPVSTEAPTLWVTAPTEEYAGLGFLVNGPFDLDVGRAQLARSSEANEAVAREASKELARAFRGLAECPFDVLQAELGVQQTSPAVFWASLFDVLTQGFTRDLSQSNIVQLVRTLMWKEAGPARQLFGAFRTLPTGLTGSHGGLTALSHVRWHTSGALEDPETFSQVTESPFLRSLIKPGSVVSAATWQRLQAVGARLDAKQLDLVQVLRMALDDALKVTTATAEQLGAFITSDRLYDPRFQVEAGDIRRLLSQARFLGNDGAYHPSRELLARNEASDEDDDETHRATFAPYGRILGGEYGPEGVAFFKACRGRLHAPVDELATWILQAPNEMRLAALKYLLNGELGRAVSRELVGELPGSWLESLDDVPGLSRPEVLMLKLQLGLHVTELDSVGEGEVEEIPRLHSYDPKVLLEHVYKRWQEEKAELLEQHDRATYPETLKVSMDYDPSSLADRRHWLTLLLLGALRTMGRSRPEQNRGFLQKCIRRGWMDVFADPDPDRARWMSILEDYFADAPENANEGEYRHWMTQFVTIYQLSRWLDDYVELILGLQRAKSSQDVEQRWKPREDPNEQGGGINAPSVDKALKLGRHFVMRELVRHRILTNPLLHKFCFTPSRRIRRVLACIGCEVGGDDIHSSKVIFEFVEQHLGSERASYDLAFDLPFLSGLHA